MPKTLFFFSITNVIKQKYTNFDKRFLMHADKTAITIFRKIILNEYNSTKILANPI